MKEILYDTKLANEWIEWVEKPNKQGTREKELYPYIKKWFKTTSAKNIVDIGCGQGECTMLVGKRAYIGVDQSPILIRRARKLYQTKDKKFVTGDAYNIPLKNASADAAISVWVWSHIKDLKKAAKEMHRILSPNGRFIIITANPQTYTERKTFYSKYQINGGLLIGDFDLGGGKRLTGSTFYLHTIGQIKDAIKRSGLRITRISKMGKAKKSDKRLYILIEGKR